MNWHLHRFFVASKKEPALYFRDVVICRFSNIKGNTSKISGIVKKRPVNTKNLRNNSKWLRKVDYVHALCFMSNDYICTQIFENIKQQN